MEAYFKKCEEWLDPAQCAKAFALDNGKLRFQEYRHQLVQAAENPSNSRSR